ncbi:uncharacterized protein LOC144442190 isoform X1 [Glandiceps talaboti]
MKFDNENMDHMMPSGYYNSPRRQAAHAFAHQNGYPSSNIIPNGTPRNGPGFSFRKRFERVDWRKMASVDVDRVSRDLDFTILQDNIMNLTFCNIEQEIDTRTIDPNFIKLFKLAQLTIEYLLHSQDYLANTISVLEDKLHNAMQEHENTKQILHKQGEEMKTIKKENRKRKKMLEAQQSLIQAGANNYHKCQYCQKAFINASFLQAHMQRRHPEFVLPQATLDMQSHAAKANERLEKEMDDLRARLKHAEGQIDEERRHYQEQLSAREHSEMLRKEEEHRKEMDGQRQKQDQVEREMDNLRDMFTKELKDMHDKYSKSQQELEDLQGKYGKKSNLGTLVDDDDLAEQKAQLQRQREEYRQMQEDFKVQISSMKGSMQDQMKSQDNKWRNRIKDLKDELADTRLALKKERQGGDQVGLHYEKQLKDTKKQVKEQDRIIKTQEQQLKELAGRVPSPTPMKTSTPSKKVTYLESKPPPSPPIITTQEPSFETEREPIDEDIDETSEQITEQSVESPSEYENQDPRDLVGLRKELENLLDQQLELKGVLRGSKGISNQSYSNKIAALKSDRQQHIKKYKNFVDIRDHFKTDMETETKIKAKEMKKSRASPRARASSAPGDIHKVQVEKRRSKTPVKSGRSKTPEKARLVKEKKKGKGGPGAYPRDSPPPVAPRSPDKIGTMSTMSTTGSWDTTTYTRTEYDDEDSEEEDEEEETETEEGSEEEEEEEGEEEESYSQWDTDEEESELKHLKSSTEVDSARPTYGVGNRQSQGKGLTVDPSPELKSITEVDELSSRNDDKADTGLIKTGSSVKNLAASIERQLSGRGGQKPTGGIDVSGSLTQPDTRGRDPSDGSPTPRIPTMGDEDDEESDFSVSSIDDMSSAAGPRPVAASNQQPAPAARHRTVSETDSSNTYGTSMWGSASHKGPGPSKEAGSRTPSAHGTVSVTDWDDDLDLSEL